MLFCTKSRGTLGARGLGMDVDGAYTIRPIGTGGTFAGFGSFVSGATSPAASGAGVSPDTSAAGSLDRFRLSKLLLRTVLP